MRFLPCLPQPCPMACSISGEERIRSLDLPMALTQAWHPLVSLTHVQVLIAEPSTMRLLILQLSLHAILQPETIGFAMAVTTLSGLLPSQSMTHALSAGEYLMAEQEASGLPVPHILQTGITEALHSLSQAVGMLGILVLVTLTREQALSSLLVHSLTIGRQRLPRRLLLLSRSSLEILLQTMTSSLMSMEDPGAKAMQSGARSSNIPDFNIEST